VLDSALDLIKATVQLEQPTAAGQRTVGTGFLISARNADGSPRTILITANHVFADMKGPQVRIGYRTANPDGSWTYTPQPLPIRNAAGAPLWTAHPSRDVAAITIKAPPEFARAAIPMNYLATEQDFASQRLSPGDELFALGFPEGLAANTAGFPILRSGRIASYPVSPAVSPTFLMDFAVFPGNSGGPVFTTRGLQPASITDVRPMIAGILTQQVELGRERLEIGIVTHAKYVIETIDLLYGGQRPVEPAAPPPVPGAQPAAATPRPPPPSLWDAPLQWARERLAAARHGAGEALHALIDRLFGARGGRSPGALGSDRHIA
jgi:hypothetical protein